MSHIADLEQALRNRWDRETLAVYADCLQAAGDPRGELIAIDLHIEAKGATAALERRRCEQLHAWLGGAVARVPGDREDGCGAPPGAARAGEGDGRGGATAAHARARWPARARGQRDRGAAPPRATRRGRHRPRWAAPRRRGARSGDRHRAPLSGVPAPARADRPPAASAARAAPVAAARHAGAHRSDHGQAPARARPVQDPHVEPLEDRARARRLRHAPRGRLRRAAADARRTWTLFWRFLASTETRFPAAPLARALALLDDIDLATGGSGPWGMLGEELRSLDLDPDATAEIWKIPRFLVRV